MSDLTAGAGEAYAACKTLFEDLNRLAIDFGHAIRNTGVDLPKSEEYSYSPHELFVKRDHVWMSYRLDEGILAFAAAYVILEKGPTHIKIGPPGAPRDLVPPGPRHQAKDQHRRGRPRHVHGSRVATLPSQACCRRRCHTLQLRRRR